MAKATKPKAAEKKVEEVKPETPKVDKVETLAGTMDVATSQSASPAPEIKEAFVPIPDTMKPLTGDIVKEVIPEPEKKVEVIFDEKPLAAKTIELVNQNVVLSGVELSDKQKVFNYLEDKSGDVRLNDFLKSLFPLPKSGEPPIWLQQGSSRYLRGLLEGMVAANKVVIKENRHRFLGQSYYPDATTGIQKHHNLNTVEVLAKK